MMREKEGRRKEGDIRKKSLGKSGSRWKQKKVLRKERQKKSKTLEKGWGRKDYQFQRRKKKERKEETELYREEEVLAAAVFSKAHTDISGSSFFLFFLQTEMEERKRNVSKSLP